MSAISGYRSSRISASLADKASRGPLVAVAVITGLGVLVRGVPVALTDFPLNDGGLFIQMARAVRESGFALPTHVAYNGDLIPFAYPPLAFYLIASMSALGASETDILRFLPFAVSVLTIPVAFVLFRQLADDHLSPYIAAAAFALMPRSYDWLIGGGGATRSLGFIFALCALIAATRMYRTEELRWAILAGVALAASGLSHPQAAVFAGFSCALLLPFRASALQLGFRQLAVAVLTGGVVLSPWIAISLSRHGVGPFVSGASTGGTLWDGLLPLITFQLSGGLVEVLGILGGFGLVVSLIRRRWLYPLWVAVILVIDPRAGLTYASIPVAGAIGWAAIDVLRTIRIRPPFSLRSVQRPGVAFGLVLLTILGVGDSVASRWRTISPLAALTADQRGAMAWAARSTPTHSRFLIIAGSSWQLDSVSEWFPVLSNRVSVATVQGSEWLGRGIFHERERRYLWLQYCAAVTELNCAQEWSEQLGRVDFLVLLEGKVPSPRGSPCCLQTAGRYVAEGWPIVYRGSGLLVFRLVR